MDDLYKGDSPSKKYARFRYWVEVQRHLGEDRFFSGTHLVLASREGGDIASLIGLGVRPSQIVAVERNPEAALAVQDKYERVNVICSDAVLISKEYRRRLFSAFLDFCGNITDKMVNDILQVLMHGLKDEGVIGVTLLTGREKCDIAAAIEEEKKDLVNREGSLERAPDRWIVEAYLDMTKGKFRLADLETEAYEALNSRVGMKAFADKIRKQHRDGFEEASAAITRLHYLGRRLQDEMTKLRIIVQPVAVLEYVSSTKNSKGVPMCTILFRTLRLPRTTPVDKFHSKVAQHIFKWGFPRVLNCDQDDDSIRQEIMAYYNFLLREQPDRDAATLRRHVALTWNIQEETITAWKAHYTRGTYKDEK